MGFMNNDYTKYDMNGYHDSHCEDPNCNCDSRRYGYGTEFNGSAVVGVICITAAILISFVLPPLGFIIFWGWVLLSK